MVTVSKKANKTATASDCSWATTAQILA